MCESRGQYLANQICVATDGIGCNKSLINEIFCQASNTDLQTMKACYEGMKDKSLGDVLRKELSGSHEKLILALLNNGRGDSGVDQNLASSQANELHDIIKSGSTMMGGLKDSSEVKVRDFCDGCCVDVIQLIEGV